MPITCLVIVFWTVYVLKFFCKMFFCNLQGQSQFVCLIQVLVSSRMHVITGLKNTHTHVGQLLHLPRSLMNLPRLDSFWFSPSSRASSSVSSWSSVAVLLSWGLGWVELFPNARLSSFGSLMSLNFLRCIVNFTFYVLWILTGIIFSVAKNYRSSSTMDSYWRK
jgi:hypothetical protein